MKKNMVKCLASCLVALMVIPGCGAVTYERTVNGETTTEEMSIEDAVNQFKEDTASMENEEASSESSEVTEISLTYINNTDFDVYKMYCSMSGDDEWGDNMFPEGTSLLAGEYGDGTMRFDAEHAVWDFMIENDNGDTIEFKEIDFSEKLDSESGTITFEGNDEDGYNAFLE